MVGPVGGFEVGLAVEVQEWERPPGEPPGVRAQEPVGEREVAVVLVVVQGPRAWEPQGRQRRWHLRAASGEHRVMGTLQGAWA